MYRQLNAKMYFIIPLFRILTKLQACIFNCNAEDSTPVLPFHITVALPVDGRDYQPKHVVADTTNKKVFNYSAYCTNQNINKKTTEKQEASIPDS